MLVPSTVIGSNTIGNVPTVVLPLVVLRDLPEAVPRALAVSSTLAGDFFVVGSLANIIVVERARGAGVELTFAEHARRGVPMTLAPLVLAVVWFAACP